MTSLSILDWGRTAYSAALEMQRELVEQRRLGEIGDTLVFTEHEPVITLGRRATREHLLASEADLREHRFEVCETDRGGDITLHNPGQWVVYPIVDLRARHLGIASYLRLLERVMIDAAGECGVGAVSREGLTGAWAEGGKLGAIGVRVTHWISMHGIALNVRNDLRPFEWIVPCGIEGCRVTSLSRESGRAVPMDAARAALERAFRAAIP